MKMKMSLGEGGIKGFLARHVEKIVLGLAVLVVLWVALPDSKRKPIDDAQLGAGAIKKTASDASTHLSQDKWELIKSERFKEADNYLERARRSLIRVEPSDYPADTPLSKPLFPLDVKRTDPEIYPLEKIEVAVSYGPVIAAEDMTGRPTIRRETTTVDGRPLPPDVQAKLTKFGTPATAGAKAEGRYIVSILGQIPVKKQIAEFKARFKDAAGYNEARDFPNYGAGKEKAKLGKFYYAVERAEIAPDGTEGEWQPIGNSQKARQDETNWPTVAELADPLYVDPIWTMRLPPLMMRDLRPLALHSAVPSAAQAAEKAAEPEAEPEEDPMDDLDGPEVEDEDEFAEAEGPRTPTTRPRLSRGGEGFGFSPSSPGAEDVEFKLFRYIDMDVQPGKSYVYRVRLYIEDPNDPSPASTAPKPALSTLDKAVIERLARKPNKSEWWRLSPYSEVSQVVRVPATNQVLAGSVLPKGAPNPDDKLLRLPETMVNVMALVWDEKQAMDVPGTVLAGRGTVLNFTADVEAIDVAASVLKKLPAYEFQTNNIVLDLRGGETFNRKSDLSTPGEILLVDDDGNLVVRKELEDQTAFGENTFQPEAKAAEGSLEPETEKKPGPRTRPRPSPSGERGSGLFD